MFELETAAGVAGYLLVVGVIVVGLCWGWWVAMIALVLTLLVLFGLLNVAVGNPAGNK